MNRISKWTAAVIAGGLMISTAGLAQDATKKMTEPEVVAALKKELAAQAAADELSGVVLLAKDGKPIFRQAYGMADRGLKVPNNPETKLNLGSINKMFTRLSIEQLAENGKLSLDDTVAKWIPDYPDPDVAAKVTIRQLIDMRSGLGDIFTSEFAAAAKDRFLKPRDLFPLFAGKPLQFETGKGQRYSNAGYVVLGAIVESASKQDYYDYVREHIYKPAGMASTDSWRLDEPVPNRAVGYTKRGGDGLRNNLFQTAFKGSPAGGGYSTVDDLLRFDAALRSGVLFKDGRKIVGVGAAGGAPGCNALLEQMDGGYTLIVLANYDPPVAEKLGEKVRGWFGFVDEDGPVKVKAGGPHP
ncbi:MAG TPA: serine hydrolase domain-containing protein [Thermoanaerobaculia bacterium]|nr:serine hydrolase domain-containing protein [Thermoanaerobaculia bacterium]